MLTLLLPFLQSGSNAIDPLSDYEMTPPPEMGLVPALIAIGLVVLMIAAFWRVNTKAGEPGWAAIVPFYNVIVLLRIIGKPWWWLLLMLIPIVNIVIWLLVCIGLAKSFGQGAGYGIGIFLLGFIFVPILAFGSAQYRGPAA